MLIKSLAELESRFSRWPDAVVTAEDLSEADRLLKEVTVKVQERAVDYANSFKAPVSRKSRRADPIAGANGYMLGGLDYSLPAGDRCA
ncbi:MAG: hypothetical protein LBV80_08065 [Deltaproteobacteria bacterium]|jgi:hypothetical protein|nr:hypothetical protein [Deltaproteobacteria bacterium]